MLREQSFEADSVYLDGFSPQRNPDIWDLHTLKAVARCCRRGTRVATWTVARSVRDALAQCGFVVKKTAGIPPKRDNLQGEYNPAWAPKKALRPAQRRKASSCVVIGAGLAGAAVAASLARRGWQVTVLDAGATPACGASGLPAGVLAPHVSPDDSLLSRLSRSGVRATLQQAHALLQAGNDWKPTGVLEHCVDHARQLPAAWQKDWADAARDWTYPATPEQLAHCSLPESASALWHQKAGWIKPSKLVQAWLATPGVEWRGHASVSQLRRQAGAWQVLDAAGQELARAELVVLAAGYASRALAQSVSAVSAAESAGLSAAAPLALQAIRGQVSWAWQDSGAVKTLPPFPVNGHGSLISALPLDAGFEAGHAAGLAWVTGSSFERDNVRAEIRPEDDQHNLHRLQTLLPGIAPRLAAQFESGQVKAWAGVRCATPSRLPALGELSELSELSELGHPDLWLCSGMGSRGLTFAALCAELLAARLHAEPLPVEQRLAHALLPQRAAVTQAHGNYK
jgi:tRNA 5-methylaminomethyl-2-thiouridine biosynthesis bifunctional protein